MSQEENTIQADENKPSQTTYDEDNPHEGIDFDALFNKVVAESQASEEVTSSAPSEEEIEETTSLQPGDGTFPGDDPQGEGDSEEIQQLKQETEVDKELRELRKRNKELEEKAGKKKPGRPKLTDEEKLVRKFLKDPAAFLAKHGADDKAAVLGKRLLGAALGDNAPEDFQKQVREYGLEARLEALEAEYPGKDPDGKSIAEQAVHQVRAEMLYNDIESLIDSDLSSTPYLKTLASDDSQDAMQALENKAIALASTGKWPTARKVAQELEKDLERSIGRFRNHFGGAPDSEDEPITQETPDAGRKLPKSITRTQSTKRKSAADLRKEQESWTEEDWLKHAAAHMERLEKGLS